MLKVLSTAALSLTLASSLALPGLAAAETTGEKEQPSIQSFSAPDPVMASPELVDFAKKHGIDLSKHEAFKSILNNKGTKFEEAAGNHVTYKEATGDIPMLVLLVDFADGTVPKGAPETRIPAQQFQDLIFGDTYDPYKLPEFQQYDGENVPKDRTMQNIYKENSAGKTNLVSYDDLTDVGWVTLPETADYYLGQDKGYYNLNGYGHMGEMVSDLVETVDPTIDFSKYAVDGQVPNVFIIHAGSGAEWSGDPAQIWSHKWDLPSALYYGEYYRTGNLPEEEAFLQENEDKWTADGVSIGTYTVEPEIGGNVAGWNDSTQTYEESLKSGPFPAQAGVFAHEFGHALGLPDFYDTDYSSEGVGIYSMMAGGSWLDYPNAAPYSGNSPTTFDPFSKLFLGWAEPTVVTPENGVKEITLKPTDPNRQSEATVVKMEVPGSNGTEYFLFENLQQVGINKGLGGFGENAHGLVAWHVDENIISQYQTSGLRVNNVENTMNKRFQPENPGQMDGVTHYGLSVLQADGKYDLENYVNRGDEGDFFQTGDKLTPTTKNVHTGSYYFWKGYGATPADSGIHVTDIVENEDGTITAKFYYSFTK